jgi:hypothetical protein
MVSLKWADTDSAASISVTITDVSTTYTATIVMLSVTFSTVTRFTALLRNRYRENDINKTELS